VQAVHEDALETILKPGTPLPKMVGVKVGLILNTLILNAPASNS
jgi:hypothetical protein